MHIYLYIAPCSTNQATAKEWDPLRMAGLGLDSEENERPPEGDNS